MARDESNREDLLSEATALVERIELVDLSGVSVVAGFRADGALSVFFGEDPAYHFNAAGELRRAYCDSLLLKATQSRLVSLKRVRTEHEVQLVRHTLTDVEQEAFVSRMKNQLSRLANTIATGNFQAERQVPPDADILGRLQRWISARKEWPIAARPNL
jgi:hypothetical protein